MAGGAFDFSDPATDAYRYSEAVADELGEEAVQAYFERLGDERFGLHPGLRERFADTLLTKLKEEITRREDPQHAHAAIELISQIEKDWRNHA